MPAHLSSPSANTVLWSTALFFQEEVCVSPHLTQNSHFYYNINSMALNFILIFPTSSQTTCILRVAIFLCAGVPQSLLCS